MKKRISAKIISLMLVICMVMGVMCINVNATAAPTQSNMMFYFDGNKMDLSAPAYEYNGISYMLMEDLCKPFNAGTGWSEEWHKIVLQNSNAHIMLMPNDKTYYIDFERYDLNDAPIFIGDKVYVPVYALVVGFCGSTKVSGNRYDIRSFAWDYWQNGLLEYPGAYGSRIIKDDVSLYTYDLNQKMMMSYVDSCRADGWLPVRRIDETSNDSRKIGIILMKDGKVVIVAAVVNDDGSAGTVITMRHFE